MVDPKNKYTQMQLVSYNGVASQWGLRNRNACVGSFDEHNKWEDYEYLFLDMDTSDKVMLDFGCGPARNIVKYHDRFHRIDGVDISPINIKKAKLWLSHNKIDGCNLHLCNGVDLSGIGGSEYDVVMSTICLQHISVRDIRQNYFREFYRVLKPGGWFTAQMGYGDHPPKRGSVDYYANEYDADKTNGGADVRVGDPQQLQDDLSDAGFSDFRFWIRPVGPGDKHPNWIFFRGSK